MEADLDLRRTKGSELQMDQLTLPTEEDEARMLYNRDVEDMAHHRMDHLPGYSRHKISRGSTVPKIASQGKGLNEV